MMYRIDNPDSTGIGSSFDSPGNDCPNSLEPRRVVVLLTGGGDKPYVTGLCAALVSQGFNVCVVGGRDLDCPEITASSHVTFLDFLGPTTHNSRFLGKAMRAVRYYWKLIAFTIKCNHPLFHILWNYRLQWFDRTLLMCLYRIRGKLVFLTAHNVNASKRDGGDTWLNQLTLKCQYRLAHHTFVHTKRMQEELRNDFGVEPPKSSVIPFGINNTYPRTGLTPVEARASLGISEDAKTILFFGNIGPYKGVEYLVEAFHELVERGCDYQLVIAGKTRGGADPYAELLERTIIEGCGAARIYRFNSFIPDADVEKFFAAADVFVLPYTHVFQSGVLFLGYSFGLPVIATDVGSFRDDVSEGVTGYVCRSCNSKDLAETIERLLTNPYFLDKRRSTKRIIDIANELHSWNVVGDLTSTAYREAGRR